MQRGTLVDAVAAAAPVALCAVGAAVALPFVALPPTAYHRELVQRLTWEAAGTTPSAESPAWGLALMVPRSIGPTVPQPAPRPTRSRVTSPAGTGAAVSAYPTDSAAPSSAPVTSRLASGVSAGGPRLSTGAATSSDSAPTRDPVTTSPVVIGRSPIGSDLSPGSTSTDPPGPAASLGPVQTPPTSVVGPGWAVALQPS